MLADAPEKRRRHDEPKKLNANLIRSIPGSEESRNSLRTHKRRNRNHKVTDNRTGNTAISKRRKRRQRQMKKCKNGNENACKKLKPKNNSDLIRSLDRRSSKLSKKERRKLRRAERRRRKKERKSLKQRRQERKERQRKQKNKKSTRHKRNVQCRTKYIDTCSWPHCNRSCPKLKNPETGQEIDFLSLLKSFGLEMGSVARAIGVDINTLNNMDKDILMELLTSSKNN